MLDEKWEIAPRDETVAAWKDAAHKEWEDMRMAVYSAQVERMDQGIGKICDALKANDVERDTVVIFLSDNGGCAEFLCEDRDNSNVDDSRVVPLTRDGRQVKVGNSPDITPGGDDTYMSYDTQWANVSNTPFKRFKRWTHEGGIATPLIVNWPAGISDTGTRSGKISHTPVQLMDLNALCIDLGDGSYPTEFRGHEITPHEGESFREVLGRQRQLVEATSAWHGNMRATKRFA